MNTPKYMFAFAWALLTVAFTTAAQAQPVVPFDPSKPMLSSDLPPDEAGELRALVALARDETQSEATLRYERWQNVLNFVTSHVSTQETSIAGVLFEMMIAKVDSDEWEAANKLSLQIYARRFAEVGEKHAKTLAAGHDVAYTSDRIGDVSEALKFYRTTYHGRVELLGVDHADTLDTQDVFLKFLNAQSRSEEAIPIRRARLEHFRTTYGQDDLMTLANGALLGQALHFAGQHEEASTLLFNFYDRLVRVAPDEMKGQRTFREVLLEALASQERFDEILDFTNKELARLNPQLGQRHADALDLIRWQGHVFAQRKDYDQAATLFGEVYDKQRTLNKDYNDTVLDAAIPFGYVLAQESRWEEVLAVNQPAFDYIMENRPADITQYAGLASYLGLALMVNEKHTDALAALEPLYAGYVSQKGVDHNETQDVRFSLLKALTGSGATGKATDLAILAVESKRRSVAQSGPHLIGDLEAAAKLLAETGRHKEASKFYQEEGLERNRRDGKSDMAAQLAFLNAGEQLNLAGDFAAAAIFHATVADDLAGDNTKTAFIHRTASAVASEKAGDDDRALRIYRSVYDDRIAQDGQVSRESRQAGYNLARSLYRSGKLMEAKSLLETVVAASPLTTSSSDDPTLDIWYLHAAVLTKLGNFAASLKVREKIFNHVDQSLSDDGSAVIKATSSYAAGLSNFGRKKDAAFLFARVLSNVRRDQAVLDADWYANSAAFLTSTTELGLAAEATEMYSQILRSAITDLEVGSNLLAGLHDGYGALLFADERYAEAADHFSKALAAAEAGPRASDSFRLSVRQRLGKALTFSGQVDEGLAEMEAVFAVQKRSSGFDALHTANALAEARLNNKRAVTLALDPARFAYSKRTEMSGNIGFGAFAEAARQQSDRSGRLALTQLADVIWEIHRDSTPSAQFTEEALFALQMASDQRTGRAVSEMAARKFSGDPALEPLLRERGELIERWTTLQDRFGALAADKEQDQANRNQLASLRSKLETIERRLTSINSQVEKAAPSYFEMIAARPIELDQIQSVIRPDEAALVLMPTQYGTHVAILTDKDIMWHRSNWSNFKIRETVAELRDSLDQPLYDYDDGTSGYEVAFNRSLAHELYQELIAPFEPILHDKHHLFFAAGGALSSLPPAILVTEKPVGSDIDPLDLRKTAWLDRRFSMAQIPSLQSLYYLRSASNLPLETKPGRSYQGFGNPALGARTTDREPLRAGFSNFVGNERTVDGYLLADVEKLRGLANLPGTERELLDLGKAFRLSDTEIESSVRLSNLATETAVKQADLSNTAVIAFATHGLLAGEIDGAGEPGLVFTPPAQAGATDDGLLTVSEIAALDIDADWVILSACNTAAGDNAGSPGLSGLARAFFYAGARSMLASHWPVRDDIAPLITVATIQAVEDGSSSDRAAAFVDAVEAVRSDIDDASRAHPAAWAPFVLVGDR